MSVLDQQSIAPQFIKLRWNEPYVSSALNRKAFKTIPRGVYNGFVVKAGPGSMQVQVVHDDPTGWGLNSDLHGQDWDQASGWSIAVHASSIGYTTNVVIQAAPGNNYVFDVAPYVGQSIFAVIDVQYLQGIATTGDVMLVQAADMAVNPDFLALARIDVPATGPLTDSNIHYDDPAYPRVTPFADQYKYGYMSADQVQKIDFLEAVSGSPAFNYEYVVTADGPQDIALPTGYIYTVNADDLWVFKNGLQMTKGASRDYVEVDRGDGHGDHITWVGILRAGDRIKLRIQQYAAVASSTLQVLDEQALIDPNVIQMNFSGPGVEVIPGGPRQVTVRIGSGGGGGSLIKSCMSSNGVSMPAFTAVTKRSNNTISVCNPANGDKFYGLTLQTILPGVFGNVQIDGAASPVSAVSGFPIGADIYVAQDGTGAITTTPPDPTVGSVIRIGFADGADSVSGGVATDIVFERGRLT